MAETVHRLFIRKKPELDIHSRKLLKELRDGLGITALEDVIVYQRYDIAGIPDAIFETARHSVFFGSQPG